MQVQNKFGFSSVVELIKDRFYERSDVYHAIQYAKTTIDMNSLKIQVWQMAQERQGENDN